jgi:diadenosine tetraphosphate (Ap4A) HIT family hydrolase
MDINYQCELCLNEGGELLVRTNQWRVVLVEDAAYPGFCRVIWNEHIKEMTDLAPADRSTLMMTVCKIESIVREVMQPEKINLASLGNVVPHLHWHIIPRYNDDAHFPAPIWAEAKRVATPESLAARKARMPQLRAAIVEQLGKS